MQRMSSGISWFRESCDIKVFITKIKQCNKLPLELYLGIHYLQGVNYSLFTYRNGLLRNLTRIVIVLRSLGKTFVMLIHLKRKK